MGRNNQYAADFFSGLTTALASGAMQQIDQQQRRKREKEDQQTRQDQFFLDIALKNPELAQLPAAQIALKRAGFGSQDMEILQQLAAASAAGPAMTQLAASMPQTGGAEQATLSPETGETTQLRTPTGAVVSQGGFQPSPIPQDFFTGDVERQINVSKKGERSVSFKPASAGSRRLRNEGQARQRIMALQAQLTAQGFSSQEAQIVAVQTASREGLEIPQELQAFLQVGAPQAPAGAGAPAGVEGEIPMGVDEPSHFVSPPGGQVPAAPAQASEGLAARKTREEAKAHLEVKLDSPLSRADVANLTDPRTRKPLPFGTTVRQAARMGAVPLRPGTGAMQLANKGANAVLDQYEQLNTKLFKGVRGLSANVNGPKLFIEALANPDSDARQIWELQATLPQIIRALGEKGTLAQQDVQRGLRAVPGFNETEKSAARKIQTLRTILAAAQGVDAPAGAPAPAAQAPASVGDLGDGFTFEVVQ